MKKTAKLSLVVLGIAFFAASCKKCVTCSYEVNGQEFTSGEICGKKSEIDDVKTTWENAGTAVGVETTCKDS